MQVILNTLSCYSRLVFYQEIVFQSRCNLGQLHGDVRRPKLNDFKNFQHLYLIIKTLFYSKIHENEGSNSSNNMTCTKTISSK